jgi:Protein of unknown function (DUF3800)
MVHPRGKDKVICVLEAYCDESGIHDTAKSCAVIGLVGSARNWQKFEENWRNASGGVDFHGRRFFARAKGQRVDVHAGWTDKEAENYLLKLVTVITETNFRPVGGVVRIDDFNRLSLGDRKYMTGGLYDVDKKRFLFGGAPTKPYFVAFHECLMAGVRSVKKPTWKVHFVFDRQNEMAGYATQSYQKLLKQGCKEFRTRLGELSFKDKAGVAGLQAADLLAHCAYKRMNIDKGINKELDMVTAKLRPMTDEQKIVLFNDHTFRNRLSHIDEHTRRIWA